MLVALTCVAIAFAATGVKTAKPPYLVPTAPGVIVDPILSTGDIVPTGQVPAYQMSGIPDGLGQTECLVGTTTVINAVTGARTSGAPTPCS